MYKKYSLLLVATGLIMHSHTQALVTELQDLAKNLEQLTGSLQQPGNDVELLLEQSGYVDKKIVINGNPVYFLKVLQQGPYDCQLHALKNALYGINLPEQAPRNIEKHVALLASKELYEKLLNEWIKITLTCKHVLDSSIKDVMKAIENKTTSPRELYQIPKRISFFDAHMAFP